MLRTLHDERLVPDLVLVEKLWKTCGKAVEKNLPPRPPI
jgi:hypothetical protein